MGNRFWNDKHPKFLPFYRTWPNKAGVGKYWKRRLHKLRRKYWRDEKHQRGLPGAESEVNWRAW